MRVSHVSGDLPSPVPFPQQCQGCRRKSWLGPVPAWRNAKPDHTCEWTPHTYPVWDFIQLLDRSISGVSVGLVDWLGVVRVHPGRWLGMHEHPSMATTLPGCCDAPSYLRADVVSQPTLHLPVGFQLVSCVRGGGWPASSR